MIGEYPPFKISLFIPEQTLNNGTYNLRFNPLFIELKQISYSIKPSYLYNIKEKVQKIGQKKPLIYMSSLKYLLNFEP